MQFCSRAKGVPLYHKDDNKVLLLDNYTDHLGLILLIHIQKTENYSLSKQRMILTMTDKKLFTSIYEVFFYKITKSSKVRPLRMSLLSNQMLDMQRMLVQTPLLIDLHLKNFDQADLLFQK